MISQFAQSHGNILGFLMTGQLHDSDYQGLVPLVDAAVEKHGKVRLLFQFDDFEGWDLAARWDDLKFTARHYAHAERLALVGLQRRDEWAAGLSHSFTRGEVRYFDPGELALAWAWLEEGEVPVPVEAPLVPVGLMA